MNYFVQRKFSSAFQQTPSTQDPETTFQIAMYSISMELRKNFSYWEKSIDLRSFHWQSNQSSREINEVKVDMHSTLAAENHTTGSPVVPCLVHVAAGLILLPCRAWVPLLLAFANFYPTNKTPKRGIKGMRGTMKMAEQTREPALQRRSQALSHGYQRQCTMPR
jgi:hypothetical protein